jgi:hypothetical protein
MRQDGAAEYYAMSGKIKFPKQYVSENISSEAVRNERNICMWILPADVSDLDPYSVYRSFPKKAYRQQETKTIKPTKVCCFNLMKVPLQGPTNGILPQGAISDAMDQNDDLLFR